VGFGNISMPHNIPNLKNRIQVQMESKSRLLLLAPACPIIRSSKIDYFAREFASLASEPGEIYSFWVCFEERIRQPGI